MARAAAVLAIMLALFCAPAGAAPQRIVSLDYCADQYVLALADRGRIAALSRGATRDDSYYRRSAIGLPTTRGGLEDALAFHPDLVVRTWGGGVDAARHYARLGVPMLQLTDARDFAAARAELLYAAEALGSSARGEAMARDLDARLAALRARWPAAPPAVLYLTSSGAVSGPDVLMNAVIEAAGGRNARASPGWQVLPLEALMQRPPQIVATAFFETGQINATPFTYARHPALRRALAQARRVALPADLVSCDAWYAIGAAERLAAVIDAP